MIKETVWHPVALQCSAAHKAVPIHFGLVKGTTRKRLTRKIMTAFALCAVFFSFNPSHHSNCILGLTVPCFHRYGTFVGKLELCDVAAFHSVLTESSQPIAQVFQVYKFAGRNTVHS